MHVVISKNPEETHQIAADFAEGLKGGEFYILSGDLGSGKTTFMQGVAQGLRVDENITSPTFVLVKQYKVHRRNVKQLVHADAYRLGSGPELLGLGGFDFKDINTVTFVEWGEKVAEALPKSVKVIKFKNTSENKREIAIE
jgi:tRNA threonylcarbamoyladenosine biosynthesis protein TsaE